MKLTATHFFYGGIIAFVVFMYRDLSSGTGTTQLVDLGSSAGNADAEQLHKEVLHEDLVNQLMKEVLEATTSYTAPDAVKLDLDFRASSVLATWADGREFLANLHISTDRKNLQITDMPLQQVEVKEINSYLTSVMARAAKDVKDKTLKRIETIEDSLILYYSLDDAQ